MVLCICWLQNVSFVSAKVQLKTSCCSWSELLATVKCDGQWANIWKHSLVFEAVFSSAIGKAVQLLVI